MPYVVFKVGFNLTDDDLILLRRVWKDYPKNKVKALFEIRNNHTDFVQRVGVNSLIYLIRSLWDEWNLEVFYKS